MISTNDTSDTACHDAQQMPTPRESVEFKPKYKTVVLSDIHLGSRWSATKEATRFIKQNSCETLILCGDIIDGWAILRGKKQKWKRRHTNFIKAILDIADTTKVIYVRGNHDDFLDRVLPMEFLNIQIVEHYTYESFGVRYFVTHGDIFDKITTTMGWLSKLGDIGYHLLLSYNKFHNARRIRKGLPYESLARKVKNKVKASVSYISDYEGELVKIARDRDCGGVICGHIHHPEVSTINGIRYLNSGDWVESLSALVETHEGEWQLCFHEKPDDLIEKLKELEGQPNMDPDAILAPEKR